MILHPHEQQALDEISSGLAAAEPRLAAMLGIFTRLTAGEGDPPDEDLILAGPPVARAPRRTLGAGAPRLGAGRHSRLRRQARRNRGLAGIILPVVLLAILAVTVVFGLRSEGTCATGQHTGTARGASAAVCQGSSTPTRSPGRTPPAQHG